MMQPFISRQMTGKLLIYAQKNPPCSRRAPFEKGCLVPARRGFLSLLADLLHVGDSLVLFLFES